MNSPLSAQVKILRVLQQSEFERVGGTETLHTDARVISATHRDLSKEVAAGRFREDLYYRLNVARIVIPPLRDRPEDVELLAEHILRRVERKHGWNALSLSREALMAIRERPWPGNVRQLENTIARKGHRRRRGRTILPEHLDADESTEIAIPGNRRRPAGTVRDGCEGTMGSEAAIVSLETANGEGRLPRSLADGAPLRRPGRRLDPSEGVGTLPNPVTARYSPVPAPLTVCVSAPPPMRLSAASTSSMEPNRRSGSSAMHRQRPPRWQPTRRCWGSSAAAEEPLRSRVP